MDWGRPFSTPPTPALDSRVLGGLVVRRYPAVKWIIPSCQAKGDERPSAPWRVIPLALYPAARDCPISKFTHPRLKISRLITIFAGRNSKPPDFLIFVLTRAALNLYFLKSEVDFAILKFLKLPAQINLLNVHLGSLKMHPDQSSSLVLILNAF